LCHGIILRGYFIFGILFRGYFDVSPTTVNNIYKIRFTVAPRLKYYKLLHYTSILAGEDTINKLNESKFNSNLNRNMLLTLYI